MFPLQNPQPLSHLLKGTAGGGFEPEDRDIKLMVDWFRLGWKNFIAYNLD